MDHHRGEEHHSLDQQIQAASLILQGPPTHLQAQTYEQARCVARGSWRIW
jgi:hypothetical protein